MANGLMTKSLDEHLSRLSLGGWLIVTSSRLCHTIAWTLFPTPADQCSYSNFFVCIDFVNIIRNFKNGKKLNIGEKLHHLISLLTKF